jgi:type 1 glutamine amidotransferase
MMTVLFDNPVPPFNPFKKYSGGRPLSQKQNSIVLTWIMAVVACLQLLLAGSCCCQRNQDTSKAQAASANKIIPTKSLRVLVVTGGHNFDQEPFYRMFSDIEGIEAVPVQIDKECTYFDDVSQWDYDVIVFYNFRNELSSKGQENLLALCDQGIGMVVLHHAIAGFPGWSLWPRMVGSQYFLQDTEIDGKVWPRCTYKNDVPFQVNVEKSKSMVTAGLTNFEIVDEPFKGYRLESGNQNLLTTDEAASQKEIAWTRTFQKSKVCYIQPGHGKGAFENHHYRQLIGQAIHWAGN